MSSQCPLKCAEHSRLGAPVSGGPQPVFTPAQLILPVRAAAHCTRHDSIQWRPLAFGVGTRASERRCSLGRSSDLYSSWVGPSVSPGEPVGKACTSEAPTILVPSPLTRFTSTSFDPGRDHRDPGARVVPACSEFSHSACLTFLVWLE